MIMIVAVPAIALSMLQASVAAPTDAFRGCIRSAAEKAKTEKIAGDKIEDYLRTSCTVQMGTLKDALIAFRMKNGMTKKVAAADAEMTVEDYVATPADTYRFMADLEAKRGQATAAPAAAAANPQPPKP
ncbi:MAG TPA: hypothetical protein VIL42_09095 [Sphingomicrobium sp.]|jgi:hypothetical protein